MTRESGARGYGDRGGSRVWISRPQLSGENPARGIDTLIHELAHNAQPRESKPHGPEFHEHRVALTVLVRRLTKGYTVWPKIDRRRLRDTVPPETRKKITKKRLRERAAARTKTQTWEEKLAHAEKMLTEWDEKERRAAKRVNYWTKKLRHAEAWLRRSREGN